MFELLSLWSGHSMGMIGSAIPSGGQRPNGRMGWGCESSDYADGASFTSCSPGDEASIHRQRHLTYPQLMPGESETMHHLPPSTILVPDPFTFFLSASSKLPQTLSTPS